MQRNAENYRFWILLAQTKRSRLLVMDAFNTSQHTRTQKPYPYQPIQLAMGITVACAAKDA